jgi:hypothetical protein
MFIVCSIGAAQKGISTSWQLQYINKPNWGLRGVFEIANELKDRSRCDWGFSIPIVAITKSDRENEVKIASNYLLMVPAAFALGIENDRTLALLLSLPVTLPNLHIFYEIINKSVFLTLAQRTDYYVFRNNSQIYVYSEFSFGFKVIILDFSLKPNLSFPISKGYFRDRKPYIGIDIVF